MNTNAKRTVMRLVAGVAAVATLMGTAACGSSNSSSSDDNTLTVSYWDDEMQPIRISSRLIRISKSSRFAFLETTTTPNSIR